MADVTIPQLTERTTLDNNDLFVIEQSSAGTGSTKLGTVKDKMLGTSTINTLGASTVTGAINILNGIVNNSNAGAHNAIYRGKNFDGGVTSAQWTAIKNGTFADMFIGDYWTIGGVNYRIAAFDYYYGKPSSGTNAVPHHVVIVPDASMSSACAMADTASNADGYAGSQMFDYTANPMKAVRDTIMAAFNSGNENHILSHPMVLSSTVSSGGIVTVVSTPNADVVLMTSGNVFGDPVHTIRGSSIINDLDDFQFPLFALNPLRQTVSSGAYWLRDAIGTEGYAALFSNGIMRQVGANATQFSSTDIKIRPSFCIYQAASS